MNNPRPRPRTRRGGIAMLAAIACLALVSVAVALVMRLANEDARRTVDERGDVQRRQLLLAAIPQVTAIVNAHGDAVPIGPLPVPTEADGLLAVTAAERVGDGRLVVSVRATSGRSLDERLLFARSGDGWAFDGAEIAR